MVREGQQIPRTLIHLADQEVLGVQMVHLIPMDPVDQKGHFLLENRLVLAVLCLLAVLSVHLVLEVLVPQVVLQDQYRLQAQVNHCLHCCLLVLAVLGVLEFLLVLDYLQVLVVPLGHYHQMLHWDPGNQRVLRGQKALMVRVVRDLLDLHLALLLHLIPVVPEDQLVREVRLVLEVLEDLNLQPVQTLLADLEIQAIQPFLENLECPDFLRAPVILAAQEHPGVPSVLEHWLRGCLVSQMVR